MRALHPFAALLLAGCLTATPGGTPRDDVEETWLLGGAWTAEHTQADIDAWCAIAQRHGNECLVMESFPPQFGMRFGDDAACRAARADILTLRNISVRECVRAGASAEPDAPTSSPPSADEGAWSLHGTFAPGYTASDIEAVCRAGTGGPSCAMTRSEPPQYAFGFASREACEEARAAILAVPRARPGECVPRST